MNFKDYLKEVEDLFEVKPRKVPKKHRGMTNADKKKAKEDNKCGSCSGTGKYDNTDKKGRVPDCSACDGTGWQIGTPEYKKAKGISLDEKKILLCSDCKTKMVNGKCPKCIKEEIDYDAEAKKLGFVKLANGKWKHSKMCPEYRSMKAKNCIEDYDDICKTHAKVQKNKMKETADFDRKKPELDSYGNNYDAMSLQGRGNIKQRKRTTSARYGDNPIDDEQELNEDHQSTLDQLQQILNDAGISNDEIELGIQLSPEGKQRIAARLGTSAHQMDTLLSSLQASLNSDEKSKMIQEIDVDPESEDDVVYGKAYHKNSAPWRRNGPSEWRKYGKQPEQRFTYEPDVLGNLTIRDSETGEEKFLQGAQAMSLANELEKIDDSDAQQQILELAFLKENSIYDNFFLREFKEDSSDDNFDDEINTDSGTYNMPWRLGDSHGTMTVFFTDKDGKPVLRIQSVRDEDGNEIHGLDDDLLLVQAKDFIGKE